MIFIKLIGRSKKKETKNLTMAAFAAIFIDYFFINLVKIQMLKVDELRLKTKQRAKEIVVEHKKAKKVLKKQIAKKQKKSDDAWIAEVTDPYFYNQWINSAVNDGEMECRLVIFTSYTNREHPSEKAIHTIEEFFKKWD